MKALVKLLGLMVCIILICITCKKVEPKEEPHILPCGCIIDDDSSFHYTDCIESNTNSFFQIGDSVYNLNFINGLYFFAGYENANNFSLFFRDTLISGTSFHFEMFTEKIQPEDFFQKGSRIIDIMRISCIGIGIDAKTTQSVFTWDSVFYEDKKFKGTGSIEIIDTLFAKYGMEYYPPREIPYFPPQKIKFEFK